MRIAYDHFNPSLLPFFSSIQRTSIIDVKSHFGDILYFISVKWYSIHVFLFFLYFIRLFLV